MISQDNICNTTCVAEYNANNARIFNGTNGNLNNNNKYNSYRVRFLESQSIDIETLESYPIPLHEWYMYYQQCRKRKANKPSHLYFFVDLAKWMREICFSVNNMEYVPDQGICFVILIPRLREVIAADFSFRIVQTFYAHILTPLLEQFVFHKDSYACRKGKGGLKAVLQLQEYIFEESEGYTKDVYLAKVDFQGFFMSIDTQLAARMMCDFIIAHIEDVRLRNIMLYLTRVIYEGLPQMHCRLQSPVELLDMLADNKKMYGKANGIGVAIGNVTSQMLSCFFTTLYLVLLTDKAYKFAFYTDDTAVVVKDKEKWLLDLRYIETWLWDELHIRLHPNKRYLQHYSKGIEFLGYKLRFNRILPSDRVVHNYKYKVDCEIRRADRERPKDLEHFMQTVNSYNGMLKWCNARRLQKEVMDKIRNSRLAKYYDIAEDNSKILIKPQYTRVEYYKRKNQERKKQWTGVR